MNRIKALFTSEQDASTAKIALWYTVSNLFVSGLGFLTMPIFSRVLSKEELGQFSNFTSWESILTIVLSLNLVASIARAKYDYREEMDSYVFSILCVSNGFALLFYAASELFPGFFAGTLSMDTRYVRLLFADILVWPAFQYLQAQHRVFQKYKFCVGLSISSAIIRVVAALLLIRLMDDRLMGRTLGYVVPFVAMNLVIWGMIAKKGKTVRIGHIRYGCMIAVPMILHALAGRMLTSSDKIMIEHLCSSEKVALYTIPYTVSTIASIIWMAMNQAWAPWLFDRMDAGETETVKSRSKWYLGFFAILIVGVFLVSPEILLLMGGKQYEEAMGCMPPIILACAYQFIYSMYVNIEVFTKHTLQISVATGVAALFNLAANAVFIPLFGYQAAAYTTAAGYLLLLIIHFVVVHVRKDFAGIYDTKFIVLISAALTLIAFVMPLLYGRPPVRWGVLTVYIAALAVFCFKNRVRLLQMFRK